MFQLKAGLLNPLMPLGSLQMKPSLISMSKVIGISKCNIPAKELIKPYSQSHPCLDPSLFSILKFMIKSIAGAHAVSVSNNLSVMAAIKVPISNHSNLLLKRE